MFNAYAAKQAGGALAPFEYDPGALGPLDIEIDVRHCGVCHSDLSMWKNEWGIASYPFVGGHEVAGVVGATGEAVTRLAVGDRVGLGWHKGYCHTCAQCRGGDHNLCEDSRQTIVGHYGGFADKVRAQETSVIKLPDGLDLADAGPLLCGGITVFNPLLQFGVRPTDRVAVIGIGGLGHLALQFANAWGCEVTALTSEEKMAEAERMGAHACVNSRDPAALKAARSRFDLILSTVNVPMDWETLLAALRPKGRLHLLGAVLEPMAIPVFALLPGQRQISSSPVGAPAALDTMMRFAARHGVRPVTEHFPMSGINEAFVRLENGEARYRLVLDRE